MKLVIIEPLGVEEEKLMEIAHKALPDSVEIVSYQTKVTDTESLIERGKDADIIITSYDDITRKPDRTWKGCGHYYGCKPAIEC